MLIIFFFGMDGFSSTRASKGKIANQGQSKGNFLVATMADAQKIIHCQKRQIYISKRMGDFLASRA